jgi:hypothetical protein
MIDLANTGFHYNQAKKIIVFSILSIESQLHQAGFT